MPATALGEGLGVRRWELSDPLAMLRNARDRFMVGPAADFASDTPEAITSVRPDILLTDVMLLGAVVAGQATLRCLDGVDPQRGRTGPL